MQAGIYLHIPFCRSRCSYCDFATDVYKNGETVERYVSALVNEIKIFESSDFNCSLTQTVPIKSVNTIYFGGGTPSLLIPKLLEKILDAIYGKFPVTANSEITMEMNPATVTPDTLREYKKLGVNRASFGAQTFDDAELKRLGRRHTAQDVRETIELLRSAGFENVSFDLIAGLPRQTLKDWERNLDEALKLKPEHLSLYLLEIHEATPLAEQIRSKRQPMPDEDLSAEMYELMLKKVSEKDYEQYEISNFCRPNFQSKHNSKYWRLDTVFGFGCSAHSFDGEKKRWANERDTLKYVETIEKNLSPIVEEIEIDLKSEYAFLGLRLSEGIDLNEYKKRFGANLTEEYAEDLKRFQEAKLIEISGNRLKLTNKGYLFSNEVFAVFV
ncbi:MAG TPA: radical SAM family heme chaperone HemW [Pyrinomonadaceae bacterium]|nr:radical SAM family heme chaperone HemW [Pyrinomonadaceae bacterium]